MYARYALYASYEVVKLYAQYVGICNIHYAEYV